MKSTLLSIRLISVFTVLTLSSVSFIKAQVTAPPYRINCGGDAFNDSLGNAWEGDSHFSGGAQFSALAPETHPGLTTLYQSERYYETDPTATYSYSFDAPAGEYKVRLHFAEIYEPAAAAGYRVFDVMINGAFVLTNFDVFQEAGAGFTPVVKEFTITSGGTILIEFYNKAYHAKINGIEVIPNFATGIKNGAKKASLAELKVGTKVDLKGSEYIYHSAFKGSYDLVLRNAQGQIALTQNGHGQGELRIAGLKPGIYFLEAKSKN